MKVADIKKGNFRILFDKQDTDREYHLYMTNIKNQSILQLLKK